MSIRPVSVVICTRNRAGSLTELLWQVLRQDYERDAMEIVVVDNGSTDNTSEAVAEIAAQAGTPVRYYFEALPGVTRARNRGAEEARHPYLAYLDDDCSVGPQWLRQLMSGFDLDERVVAVGGRIRLAWAGKEKPRWLGPQLEPTLGDNGSLGASARLLQPGERIREANMALERKAWRESGGFLGMEQFGSRSMAASEIVYLLRRIHLAGGRVGFVPAAEALHLAPRRTPREVIVRGYWQGVSDAVLQRLTQERSLPWLAHRSALDLMALVALSALTLTAAVTGDRAKAVYHAMRSARRAGLLLGELQIVGDWAGVRAWLAQRGASGPQKERYVQPI